MSNSNSTNDRIAIVGIGLSLPGGVDDLDSFWSLLENKVDATTDIPSDRWDVKRFYAPYGSEKPGKMYVKRAGFLQRKIDEFDPLYFGISPREASIMDYQQRLLLELAATTFQDAGLAEEAFKGRSIGVFMGGFCMDAHVQAANADNRNWYVTQSVTGSTATMLSNRISHVFDLKGPSLTIDTACSSSLVATHYAAESILSGECETALVGGVNVMTQPEHFIEMCKGKLLSKDGKCFTWDQRANGYCRGEGAGMLLLKRLSVAQRDGDHIYAVIEATGVNQDGTTKGITSPNPASQASLIHRVLGKANLKPCDIDYVEAHGTGTQAGDKAETTALDEVFNAGRMQSLVIGSVKTNIGHLEAAAGISGLIKSILCLNKSKIPANLHFETPNSDIPFDRMCLEVATELMDWPSTEKPKYVGVNGFGYGGTNAHVILGEAPAIAAPEAPETESVVGETLLLPLSAKCDESLKALSRQYLAFLEANPEIPLKNFLRRISTRRAHYDYRAMIHAQSETELKERLGCLAGGVHCQGVTVADQACASNKLVFVYSGMGPQWWGMGRELLDEEPLFAQKIREYDEVFIKISGWSLIEELRANEHQSQVARTEIAQPLNFAVQAALTELWGSWGIRPDAVVGHSVGEVTSAYVSGILSLEDAMLVSYYRSYLQSTLANTGGMLAVGLSESAVASYLSDYAERVSVAAVNSPSAVTLAGEQRALDALAGVFESEGIFHRALKVEVPYHSPLMAPIEAEIKQCLAGLTPKPANIPCFSTVTGCLAEARDYDATYWWHNVRRSVLFAKAIDNLCDSGFHDFLEIGPHPVLNSSLKEILAHVGVPGQVFSSLNRKTPERATLLDSLCTLYSKGHNPAWLKLQTGDDRYMRLPAYPWHKSTYSYGAPKYLQDKFGEGVHPILYRNLMLPYPSWEVELSDSLFPYIKDHRIGDKIILPGAFYIEAGLAVAKRVSVGETLALENIVFDRVLSVPEDSSEEEKRIISVYTPERSGFSVYSTTTAPEETWTFHMRGEFADSVPPAGPIKVPDLEDYANWDVAEFYSTVARCGLQYGAYFQPIKRLQSNGRMVYAELENTFDQIVDGEYLLPPPVLDGVFQTMFAFGGEFKVPFVPVGIDHLALHGVIPARCKVVGRLLWISATSLKADFTLVDDDHRLLAELRGVTCQALSQMGSADQDALAQFYHTRWELRDASNEEADWRTGERQLILHCGDTLGQTLIDHSAKANSTTALHVSEFTKDAFEQVLRAGPLDTLYYMCGNQASLEDALSESVEHCMRLTELVQVLHQVQPSKEIDLFICTQRACKVIDSDLVDGVALASLAGFARTIVTEYANIRCSTIDFHDGGESESELLFDVLFERQANPAELAIRGNKLFAHRLCALEQDEAIVETLPSSAGQKIAVRDFAALNHQEHPFTAIEAAGQNASRSAEVQNGAPIDPHSVEIEVDYFTFSYWDRINSQLVVYPNDPDKHFFRYRPGMQCVGRVVGKGHLVTAVDIGDQVLSLHPHRIANFVTVPAEHAFKVPSPLRNARLPDVYDVLRARRAISLMGSPAENSVVLIQGVWGSFTETLVNYCKNNGFKPIFLDEQSSSLAFQEVEALGAAVYVAAADRHLPSAMEALVGGIDIIINIGLDDCLLLNTLKPFGQVIDFKADQIRRDYNNRFEPSNYTYCVVDIDALFAQSLGYIRAEIDAILAELASEPRMLPAVPAFGFADIASALEELKRGDASALHVTMKNEQVPLRLDRDDWALSSDGTYVITGGTQGFGLQCAHHLATKGVRYLVLMSRRGITEPSAAESVALIEEMGVKVKVCAVDTTDLKALCTALQAFRHDMPNVRGVIHSAMVLEDAYLDQLDEAKLRRVLAPKIQGALNLYAAVQDCALDFFIMFSSISSLIGNAGQGNYVAANSFLDAFAHHLASRGVPAKTINWGALSDSGVLVNNESLVKVLEMAGIYGVTNQQAMRGLDEAMTGDIAQLGVFHVDWDQWSRSNASLSKSDFYSTLLSAQDHSAEHLKLMEVLENIISKDGEGRREYIQGELANKFGAIFRMPPESINPHTSIIDLGVDSLMSVEISMGLKSQLGVDIPSIELISGPSIASLASKILEQIEALIDEVLAEDSEASA